MSVNMHAMTQGPFTAVKKEAEASLLRRLHGMLTHQAIETDAQFSDLMSAAFERDGLLSYQKLAKAMNYNLSTVHRWVSGRSVPHRAVWPTVCNLIMSEIENRIEELERDVV